MEQARGPGAEADAPEEEEGEAQEAMAAVVSAAGGACPAVLQVAGLYRGLCAVRSRALGLGFVSPAQLRVFPVRRGSGLSSGGTDGSGVSELETNPFYDRYRDKIQQLRRCDPGGVGGGDSWRAGRASGMRYCPAWYSPHYTNSLFPSSERRGHLPKVTSLQNLWIVVFVLSSQNAQENS